MTSYLQFVLGIDFNQYFMNVTQTYFHIILCGITLYHIGGMLKQHSVLSGKQHLFWLCLAFDNLHRTAFFLYKKNSGSLQTATWLDGLILECAINLSLNNFSFLGRDLIRHLVYRWMTFCIDGMPYVQCLTHIVLLDIKRAE